MYIWQIFYLSFFLNAKRVKEEEKGEGDDDDYYFFFGLEVCLILCYYSYLDYGSSGIHYLSFIV